MCLKADRYYYKDQKKGYCDGKKTITGYKVMQRVPGGKVKSIYQGTIWNPKKQKVFDSGRKSNYPNSSEYTTYEYGIIDIFKGFHFYRTREIARDVLKDKKLDSILCWYDTEDYNDYIIVKFEVDVDDVVAFSFGATEFVARKCKWVGQVRWHILTYRLSRLSLLPRRIRL